MSYRNFNFYHFSLCHYCKEPYETRQRCSSCQVVFYCSKEHQVMDWNNHKKICKAIRKTRLKLVLPTHCTPSVFNSFKTIRAASWNHHLGRGLKGDEVHMWMFPRVCSVCYANEHGITCPDCLSVVYCSKKHQNEQKTIHKEFCPGLKLNLALCQYLHSSNPVFTLDLQEIDDDIKTLPQDMKDCLAFAGLTPNEGDVFSEQHLTYVASGGFLCPAINIIFALEKIGFITERLGKKSDLVIHIVGPNEIEDCIPWDPNCDLLIKWIKNLESVEVYFVGPEIDISYDLGRKIRETLSRGIRPTFHILRDFYHEVHADLKKPDIVCAFNSGIHEHCISKEEDTWESTIPKLLYYDNVPLVLTAYTESEIKKDITCFKDVNHKFLVEPQRNPYRDLRPQRNWEEGDVPVYYQSGYITVLYKDRISDSCDQKLA